jgi:hypothetical protein
MSQLLARLFQCWPLCVAFIVGLLLGEISHLPTNLLKPQSIALNNLPHSALVHKQVVSTESKTLTTSSLQQKDIVAEPVIADKSLSTTNINRLSADELLAELIRSLSLPSDQTSSFPLYLQALVQQANLSEDVQNKLQETYLRADANSDEAALVLSILQQCDQATALLTKIAEKVASHGDAVQDKRLIDTVSYGAAITHPVLQRFKQLLSDKGNDQQVLEILSMLSPHQVDDDFKLSTQQRLQQISSSNTGESAQAFARWVAFTPFEQREAMVQQALTQDKSALQYGALQYGALQAVADGNAPYNAQIKTLLFSIALNPEHPLRSLAAQTLLQKDVLNQTEYQSLIN